MSEIAGLLRDRIAYCCNFSKVLAELDTDDKEAIYEAVEADVPSNFIANAIKKGGWPMSHGTVEAHRNNECNRKGIKNDNSI